jgi:hypothetical protein
VGEFQVKMKVEKVPQTVVDTRTVTEAVKEVKA